jgi:hypothetical protein
MNFKLLIVTIENFDKKMTRLFKFYDECAELGHWNKDTKDLSFDAPDEYKILRDKYWKDVITPIQLLISPFLYAQRRIELEYFSLYFILQCIVLFLGTVSSLRIVWTTSQPIFFGLQLVLADNGHTGVVLLGCGMVFLIYPWYSTTTFIEKLYEQYCTKQQVQTKRNLLSTISITFGYLLLVHIVLVSVLLLLYIICGLFNHIFLFKA